MRCAGAGRRRTRADSEPHVRRQPHLLSRLSDAPATLGSRAADAQRAMPSSTMSPTRMRGLMRANTVLENDLESRAPRAARRRAGSGVRRRRSARCRRWAAAIAGCLCRPSSCRSRIRRPAPASRPRGSSSVDAVYRLHVTDDALEQPAPDRKMHLQIFDLEQRRAFAGRRRCQTPAPAIAVSAGAGRGVSTSGSARAGSRPSRRPAPGLRCGSASRHVAAIGEAATRERAGRAAARCPESRPAPIALAAPGSASNSLRL